MRINKPDIPRRYRPRGLEILHEDRDILVILKETGLLTMSPRRDETRTAEVILTNYLRKGNPRSHARAFVVHRLDRDTSGLLVFAKSFPTQERLKGDWSRTQKHDLAAVHGRPDPNAGVITSYLEEDDDQVVRSGARERGGKLAHTSYAVIKTVETISILKINLLTGRKNQIRAHLSEKGWPVVGDLKYGQPGTSKERLFLHAKTLAFHHPFHDERIEFDAGIPEAFARLARGLTEADWARVACPTRP